MEVSEKSGEMTQPPEILVNLVLGTVHMWHLRGHRSNVVDLIVKHFTASELLEGRRVLCTAVGAAEPVARRDSDHRSAAAAQAVDLLDQVGELDSQGKLPVIVVPSTQLAKVPVSTLLASDDVAVGARLESLEKSMKLLADSVTSMKTVVTSANHSQGLFAGARVRANSNSGVRGGGQVLHGGGNVQGLVAQPGNVHGAPQVHLTPPQEGGGSGPSWANVARSEGPPSTQGHLGTRDRLGSEAEKRKREGEEFRFQGRQRGRKVEVGRSTVDIEEGGEAAPLEYYVGNTTPRATPEIIKAVLQKCAAQLTKDLQVLEVKCLTNGIENPRTKSWKVRVPYKYKELMEKNDLYPEGWTYRKFFAPRNMNQGVGGGGYKKPRPDDELIGQVLQEQQQQLGVADNVGDNGPGKAAPYQG